jgi:hypothetical protein
MITALVIAYLAAGIAYVVGDAREHVIRQPAYVREYTQRGRIGPLIPAMLLWPAMTLVRRRWGVILIFVIVVGIGYAI